MTDLDHDQVVSPLDIEVHQGAGCESLKVVLTERRKLISDHQFMLEAVKQDGRALEYASEELRGDREVVLEAVKQDEFGSTLQYASPELRGDLQMIWLSRCVLACGCAYGCDVCLLHHQQHHSN